MKKLLIIISILFIYCSAFAGNIYHFDRYSKKYKRSSIAKIDPSEGTDMIPAHATNLVPPVCGDNEAAIFESGNWVKKIDRIDQYYYEPDGTKIEINNFGIDIPSGMLIENPPTIYHDTHNGIVWIENIALKDQDIILQEISLIKIDLRAALVEQFKMILELFEVGKANGVWTNTDFSTEIKQKAAIWKEKINRLDELE